MAEYEIHTFAVSDTGIGQSMGYESDKAFLEAQRAEEAKLDPEVREALQKARDEVLRTFLFGE